MNLYRHRVLSLAAFLAFLVTTNSSSAQQTSGPSKETTRYLKAMTDSVKRSEDRIKELRKRGEDAQADRLAQTELPRYQRQLKIAEQTVADGKEFGRTEYLAAMKAIVDEATAEHQRAMSEITQKAKETRRESERKFEQTMAEIKKKHEESKSKSEETFRLQVETSTLRRKFGSSRGQVGMVIWNLPHDQKLHKRFTTAVAIQLFNGDKVVWKKNIKLNRKLPNNPIRLPNVMFDSVAVEITKWAGSGGGLSEIQVFLANDNVAAARPCDVTNIETLPIHLDDQHALTDGITRPTALGEGYWIPEDNTKATATIYLLGKKVETRPVFSQPFVRP